MGNTSGSMNVSIVLPISLIAFCLVLSCVGYVLSERTHRQRQQAHIINEVYAPEQVFTIDLPSIQTMEEQK